MTSQTLSTTATGPASPLRTRSAAALRVLAMAGGTLTVIQFALAGFGAFAEANGGHDKYGMHELTGTVIGVVSILVLVAALLARPSRQTVVQSVVLALLAAPIQPILASLGRHTASWVGGLHAVVGLAIMGLFGVLSRRTSWTWPR